MNKLEELQEQIRILEKRITALEHIINGTASGRVGRKPKLTLEDKENIKEKHSSGISYAKLAEQYSVSKSTICNICKNSKKNSMVVDIITIGR